MIWPKSKALRIAYEGQNQEVAQEAAKTQRDTRQKILDLNTRAARWFQERLLEPGQDTALPYLQKTIPG